MKSQETGATRVVTTDDAGNYRVLSLPLGPQEVKAEKKGFKAVVRTGINLAVGQEAVVNLRLEVGEFVQQVAVTAEAPVVNVTTAPVSGMVGERQIKELPLNGRSFDNLITLNPGTINYSAMKSPTPAPATEIPSRWPGGGLRRTFFCSMASSTRDRASLPSHPAASAVICWGLTPSGSSTCSRTPMAPNMASAPEHKSASSRNPGPMRCTERFSSSCETARSIRRDLRPGNRSSLPEKPIRRRAGRPAQERSFVPVRQLRRIPAGLGGQQFECSPRCPGPQGCSQILARVYGQSPI